MVRHDVEGDISPPPSSTAVVRDVLSQISTADTMGLSVFGDIDTPKDVCFTRETLQHMADRRALRCTWPVLCRA